jgi:putative transposase
MKSSSIHGECHLDRASIPESWRRLDTWPAVDVTALPEKKRARFQNRRDAVTLYLTAPERSVALITQQTGIDRATLMRQVVRCTTTHPDGRVYGFRAAVPGIPVKPYERFDSVKFGQKGGKAGVFTQLLQRYPDIAAFLRRSFEARNRPIRDESEVRQSMRSIHQDFLKKCRSAGIHSDQYPFTEQRRGMRSLYAYFNRLAEGSFEMSVKNAGGQKVQAAPTDSLHAPAATRAYEVVEFDGHKIDLRLTVRIRDPYGVEHLRELPRIWLLVVLDVATRCVLGYHVALSVEYSKSDVASVLQASLKPFQPRAYRIPTLAIREGGGYPSAVVPGTQFAC